jgi:hypothetical protein
MVNINFVQVVHVNQDNGVCKYDHENKEDEVTHYFLQSFFNYEDLNDLLFTETSFCEQTNMLSKYDFLRVDIAVLVEFLQLPNMVSCFDETVAEASVIRLDDDICAICQKSFKFDSSPADMVFIVGPDEVRIPAHKAVITGNH